MLSPPTPFWDCYKSTFANVVTAFDHTFAEGLWNFFVYHKTPFLFHALPKIEIQIPLDRQEELEAPEAPKARLSLEKYSITFRWIFLQVQRNKVQYMHQNLLNSKRQQFLFQFELKNSRPLAHQSDPYAF